ncbi:MAG TPA: PAS domain-containing protein [Steroidobacteraceae bacterium]|jgi:predicted transcriptional regulator YheO
MNYVSIAEALARLFGPIVEIVLHDLRTGKIAHIANVWLGRDVGDSSQLDLENANFSDEEVLGPYEKAGPQGERVRSATAVLRNLDGVAIALLCVNLDFSKLDAMSNLISGLFPDKTLAPYPDAFRKDWQEQLNSVIRDFLLEKRTTLARLDRSEREELIASIDDRGIFEIRHSAKYVAVQLGISRATVYNVLNRKRCQLRGVARSRIR